MRTVEAIVELIHLVRADWEVECSEDEEHNLGLSHEGCSEVEEQARRENLEVRCWWS